MRKVLALTLALAAAVLSTALIGSGHAVPRKPVLSLVSVEPAGIFDEGGEMSLVTLAIGNPDNLPHPENTLHVRGLSKTKTIEARVTNVWVGAEGTLVCGLPCGQKAEHVFLLPAGADCCRVSFQYTGSSRSFNRRPVRGRLAWLTERLPLSVRSRLSYRFWRWVGFGPDYLPSSDWRAVTVEIPLSPPSGLPTHASVGAHNQARHPRPVEGQFACLESAARRGCAR